MVQDYYVLLLMRWLNNPRLLALKPGRAVSAAPPNQVLQRTVLPLRLSLPLSALGRSQTKGGQSRDREGHRIAGGPLTEYQMSHIAPASRYMLARRTLIASKSSN
jgi:hypothetical protein